MNGIKIGVIACFAVFGLAACFSSDPDHFVIADSKAYEATLYRQNCAICHGPEGDGKTLEDGVVVPSLRVGEFKARTETEVYKQIADGGNGMLAFRSLLSDREIRLLTDMVRRDLRKAK